MDELEIEEIRAWQEEKATQRFFKEISTYREMAISRMLDATFKNEPHKATLALGGLILLDEIMGIPDTVVEEIKLKEDSDE